ncbi:MAG: hypothetical protein HYV97_18720 [Bdellovibrio sp.]|nr:hypothetical protein [Bdellovibrio sp.]
MNSNWMLLNALFALTCLTYLSCRPNTGMDEKLATELNRKPPTNTDKVASYGTTIIDLHETVLPSMDITDNNRGGFDIATAQSGDLHIAALLQVVDLDQGGLRHVLYYWHNVAGTWQGKVVLSSTERFYHYSINYGERNHVRIVHGPVGAEAVYYLNQNRILMKADPQTGQVTSLNVKCKAFDAKLNPIDHDTTIACLEYDNTNVSVQLINQDGTVNMISLSDAYTIGDGNIEIEFINGDTVVLFKGRDTFTKTNQLIALFHGETFILSAGIRLEGTTNAQIEDGTLWTCARDFYDQRFFLAVDFSLGKVIKYPVSFDKKIASPYSCRVHNFGRVYLQFNSYNDYSARINLVEYGMARSEITSYLTEMMMVKSVRNKLYVLGVDRKKARLFAEK